MTYTLTLSAEDYRMMRTLRDFRVSHTSGGKYATAQNQRVSAAVVERLIDAGLAKDGAGRIELTTEGRAELDAYIYDRWNNKHVPCPTGIHPIGGAR